MKVVWNYIFILTGLALFLQICGIQIGGLSQLFTMLGITPTSSGVSVSNWSPFMITVLAILAAASVAGVIIGIFSRTSPENYIIVPLVGTSLYLYVSMIYSIITFSTSSSGGVLSTIAGVVTVLIMTPAAISLTAAFVDYFRGGDF